MCTTTVVLQEAALRAFYLPDEPQDYELLEIGCMQRLHGDDSKAWLLRAKPGDTEVIKVYAGWPR